MRIGVVNVTYGREKAAMNKDLNGGFGTHDVYSGTLYEKILMSYKKKYINLPVVSLAFLMGIFKQRNIPARFYEGTLPKTGDDIILIYGSIVDYKNENLVCRELKSKFKDAKVGFIGPFPSLKPELFPSGDFVIAGDFEYFFLKSFKSSDQLNGVVRVEEKADMDELPPPEIEGFPLKEYRYFPLNPKGLFFSLQASRGCPYSCSYYCVYGRFQGSRVSLRSPQKVLGDMVYLADKYGISSYQFRDPVFGIKDGYIEDLCAEIKKSGLEVRWGVETRLDLLDENKVRLMYGAGLRNINIGIETVDQEIAQRNKRSLVEMGHQEGMVRFCEKTGVRITAFYLFGYEDDTRDSMRKVLSYAKKLNTSMVRFAVYTPYPGTDYFAELEKEGRILTHDYEKYTQFNLVFKHKNLSENDIRDMLSRAYREYYFRPAYLCKLLKWRLRGF